MFVKKTAKRRKNTKKADEEEEREDRKKTKDEKVIKETNVFDWIYMRAFIYESELSVMNEE